MVRSRRHTVSRADQHLSLFACHCGRAAVRAATGRVIGKLRRRHASAPSTIRTDSALQNEIISANRCEPSNDIVKIRIREISLCRAIKSRTDIFALACAYPRHFCLGYLRCAERALQQPGLGEADITTTAEDHMVVHWNVQ